ncbi:MAG TPA: PQQ-binding-like beta-propeller repeat protein [Planctomycetota bacterium]|nr:PQQ-binding-like beta-propeller repeat protein [Planctomycetota bacterium]
MNVKSRMRVVVWTLVGASGLAGQDASATRPCDTKPAAASRPAGWTEFRGGPFNVGVASGPAPALRRIRWTYQSASAVRCQPIVADGRVIVLTQESLVAAVRASDGRELWRRRVEAPLRDADGAPAGEGFAWAAPLAIGDLVVAAHEGGVVYALDAATGEIRWRRRVSDRIWAAPKTDGFRIYVSTYDGAFVALDPATGDEVRRTPLHYEIGATPTLVGRTAWQPLRHGLRMCVVDLDTGLAENVETGWNSASTPASALARLYLTNSRGEDLCFDPVRRETLWRRKQPGDFDRNGPACDGERVYFARSGAVRAYDPFSGETVWERILMFPIYASPTVVDDVLILPTAGKNVFALSRGTGRIVASLDLPEEIVGSAAVADGSAYLAGSATGGVYAID